MIDHRIDWKRFERTGISEAILCDVKTDHQVLRILETAEHAGQRLLLTRLTSERRKTLAYASLDYHEPSQTAVLGGIDGELLDSGIGIVTAGTSDLQIAGEASRTLAFHGVQSEIIADVGVAGIWRLMEQIDVLRQFRILIAIAGMEGALFTVLAGLVRAPVIAVPSAAGYGVAEGGRVALGSALASCASGVLVVNTGNGFGAACGALRILGER
jgi:NCAIR mutase (PurE)-related protein